MLHYHQLICSEYGLSSSAVPWDRSRWNYTIAVCLDSGMHVGITLHYHSEDICPVRKHARLFLPISPSFWYRNHQKDTLHWCEYRGGCKLNKPACASLPSTANLNIDASLTYTAMQLFAFWNIIWLKCWKTFHLFYSILTVKKWFKLM